MDKYVAPNKISSLVDDIKFIDRNVINIIFIYCNRNVNCLEDRIVKKPIFPLVMRCNLRRLDILIFFKERKGVGFEKNFELFQKSFYVFWNSRISPVTLLESHLPLKWRPYGSSMLRHQPETDTCSRRPAKLAE